MAVINSGDLLATSYQTEHAAFDGDALGAIDTPPPVRALAVSDNSLLRAKAGTFADEKSVMFDI
jgi:hypothetical protein